jgi:hypothetical protein
MAKISTYPQPTPPQLGDYVIGTDISDLLMTKNYLLSDIITLATTTNQFVTIVGAQTITGSKTFDYGTSTGVFAPVIINLPAQTQPSFSPDALLIQINGQVPSTTPGAIGGVNVQAHLLDNICYYADLFGDSGVSRGIVIISSDSHNGNFLEFTKKITSPASDVLKFSVGSEGNTQVTASSGYAFQATTGALATDIGIYTGAYIGTGILTGTYGGIAIDASASALGGIAVKAIGNNTATGLYLKGQLSIEGDVGSAGEIFKSNGPGVSPSWVPESKGYFYNSATQTFITANVGVPLTLPLYIPDNTSGISVVTDGSALNRITFSVAGSYRVSPNITIVNTVTPNASVYVWLRKNGVDLSLTARVFTIGNVLVYQNFSLDYAVSVAANDYIQVMCSATNASLLIAAESPTVYRPGIPSSVVTINSI